MSAGELASTFLDGRFRVEATVGVGRTSGFVYRARDVETGAPVAVRALAVPDGLAGAALDDALATFASEATLLARVSAASADAERLLAHGVSAGVPFCVFEWLEGQSLETHLAEGGGATRSIGETLTILEPAVRALGAAHAMDVAHGDVRPANLWLAKSDSRTRVKLTQFVLASRLGTSSEPLFAPRYGAPEHFKRSYGPVGPATDVYGLALTLVEMVSGRPALDGADETDLYLATSDIKKRPTLRARGVAVSDAVEAVLQRALSVDPKRRYEGARAFWDALLAAVPELTPAPPSVRPHAEAATVAATPPLPAPAPAPERSGTRAWIATGAFAAIAVAVIAVKLAGGTASKTATTIASSASDAPAPPPPASSSASPLPSPSPAPSRPDEPSVHVKPFLTDMVSVPAGSFTMGVDFEGKGDGPSHRVRISHAFTIDRTEVTAEAYAACIEEGVCTPGSVHGPEVPQNEFGCNGKDRPRHPANCVDRAQAEKYCAFVGKRLPTEAEWEYAARSDDRRAWPWGNAAPTACTTAVVSTMTGACAERAGTSEVGSAPDGKSPFGALDMAGNVWEWVADGFEPYRATPDGGEIVDPKVPTPQNNRGVLRGGSWDYSPLAAKTTFRLPYPANAGNASIGFRCARDAVD